MNSKVNTASRIETTGLPGRIHASQAFADAVIAKGKGEWLTEREDKVFAKGKGEMTTYFVTIPSGTSKSTTSTIVSSNVSGSFGDPSGSRLEEEKALQHVDC